MLVGIQSLSLELGMHRAGLQPLDADVGRWLRKLAPHVRVKVLLNKAEGMHADANGALEAAMGEAHSLGFGAPVAVSAESGEGLADLYENLRPWVEKAQEEMLALQEGTCFKQVFHHLLNFLHNLQGNYDPSIQCAICIAYNCGTHYLCFVNRFLFLPVSSYAVTSFDCMWFECCHFYLSCKVFQVFTSPPTELNM
jgi:hypothetical protein